ncbi:DUF3077 domain-containing protein [Pseudomonas putida]|uniref:DUF3077 domain-containing protein n=1 Tax=Pseudomonas putida TaxID=303 RepID=UPI0007B951F6|nr:DUF3077 domain-containing protein [Pseudomonas putida]
MDNDDQSNKRDGLKLVSAPARIRREPRMAWVQAIPGLPPKETLMEISTLLGCVTELTRRAIDKPQDAEPLMRATHYLCGMSKAMIDGQLTIVRGEVPVEEGA